MHVLYLTFFKVNRRQFNNMRINFCDHRYKLRQKTIYKLKLTSSFFIICFNDEIEGKKIIKVAKPTSKEDFFMEIYKCFHFMNFFYFSAFSKFFLYFLSFLIFSLFFKFF